MPQIVIRCHELLPNAWFSVAFLFHLGIAACSAAVLSLVLCDVVAKGAQVGASNATTVPLETAAKPDPTAAPTNGSGEVPLLPLSLIFGNPTRGGPKVCPGSHPCQGTVSTADEALDEE